MKNVMLDLETMGTRANSAIVAIGAVEFDEDLGIIERFYETIDLQTCLDKGMEVTGSTVMWWMKQSEEARRSICKDNIPLKDALKQFRDWLGKDNLQLWGNSAAFDNTIIKNAYAKFGIDNPWPYWSDRCYMTIKNSLPQLNMKRVGTFHKAVDDAEHQANHLLKLVKRNKLQDIL